MTYSIVARDEHTGQLGAAIQSKAFACGVGTLWPEAGVGMAATQSFTDPGYGPLCLLAMRSGASAEEALAGAVARDRRRDVRQVGVVSAAGDSAAHTGQSCIAEAGHVTADGISCQANMMDRPTVWPAMLQAFGEAQGSLAQRLLRALEAAQSEGGDWRGQEAGRVLVVSAEPTGRPWDDVVLDVRVDNHPQPVAELGRLVARQEALVAMRKPEGRSAAAAVETATDAGLEPVEVALAALFAISDGGGDPAEARAHFERALAIDPRYAELARRLPGMAVMLGLEPLEPESS